MSHGRSMLDTLTHWTPHYASPEIAEGYERKLAENANGVALAPGAANLHAAIPPSRFGMFTGAKSFTAEARLKQCHLDRPKSLITGDMVKHGKPDPEGLVEIPKSKKLVCIHQQQFDL
jgi:sugar-phosphatase